MSRRGATGWEEKNGEGVQGGGEKRKKKETKEVQKERTGLSLCFGWKGIQGGMRREKE